MKLTLSNYARIFTLLSFWLVEAYSSSSAHVSWPFSNFGLFGHYYKDVKAATSQYEKYFDQKTDQFDQPNKTHYQNFVKTFKQGKSVLVQFNFEDSQRYFFNSQWKNTNNGNSHILWLEGEGSASDVAVTDINLPHVALAREVGATIWALEHRFRGKSQPFRRTFHSNYADYLSSAQAVEDIMNFINSTNIASKETNPKWVVVGRNYGAVLALWFRQKYPQLSVGAIADSPAVMPTANFYNYQKFIEESYSNYSYDCWHGTKFSALAIRNELQYTAGIQTLNDELKITPPISWKMDYKNYQHLHHNLIGLFEIPILYSKVNIGPFSTSCGIDDFCKFMENRKGRDIHRVYNWAKHFYSSTHGGKDDWPGIDNSYENMIKWLNNTRPEPDDTEQLSARSWLYQQCHEFGQFITTDSGHGLFWSTVPNERDVREFLFARKRKDDYLAHCICYNDRVFFYWIYQYIFDRDGRNEIFQNISTAYYLTHNIPSENNITALDLIRKCREEVRLLIGAQLRIKKPGADIFDSIPSLDFTGTTLSVKIPPGRERNLYWIGVCTDVFEEKIFTYTVDNLKDGIKNLKKTFDTTQQYKGSNTIIFNGGTDPWQLLGVNSVADKSSVVCTVPGVGHAPVLMPSASTDSSELTYARQNLMFPTVKKWLKTKSSKALKQLSDHKAKTQNYLPPIVFKEIKRLVTSISYPSNQSVHINLELTFPSEKETVRRGYFPFNGGSIHQQMDKYLRTKMNREKFNNSTYNQAKGAVPKNSNLRAGYVDQDVDHFDSASNLVFKQRFFNNDLFQEDKDAVRFLMIGGESPLNAYYVEDDYLHYFRWAKDFRAVIYALEHRFYGYSNPFSNCSTVILAKYLNTEQVLADIAVFINTMNKVDNNTNPRWIIFGGSYAGNLVAAFRLRYPSLSLGGIASSAPLQAKTDFFEYTQKIEKDVHTYGPKWCPSAMRRYFAFIRKYMNVRNGRVALKQIFCIDNRWDENYIDGNDARFFPIEQLFMLEHAIQYDTEDHKQLLNYCYYYYSFDYYYGADVQKRNRRISRRKKKAADQFLRAVNPIKRLGKEGSKKATDKPTPTNPDYYQYPDDDEDSDNFHDYDDSQPSRGDDADSGYVETVCPSHCADCIRVSYNQYLENLEDMNRHCYNGTYCSDQSRLWLWLQCSQWGYMQSTNYGYNIFGSALPINFYLNLCTDVFGSQYNRSLVDQIVARTNAAYGGQENYNGTNVMFINGSEDPWGVLSVYEPLQPEKNVTSILVPGVSHCADMKREDVHDAQELKDARKEIKKQLVRWVQRPKGPHTGDNK